MINFLKKLWTLEFIGDLFTVLWLMDTVFTTIFVYYGGIELEANPIMYKAIETFGLLGFVVIKLLILEFFLRFLVVDKTWVKIAGWAVCLITFHAAFLGFLMLKLMFVGL